MMMAAAAPGAGPGAGPGSVLLGLGAGSVSLTVSSTLNSFRAHKRYGTGLTIAELKCKLELLVGSPASCMALELYGPREELLAQLDQDEALLGSYPVADGCRLHVIDGSGARRGEYEDVSRVPKYEMDDSDYDKRPDSLRSFLRRRGWGRYSGGSPGGGSPLEGGSPGRRRGQEDQVTSSLPPLGSRCQVRVPGQPTKRATILYVGQTDFKPGHWVGVRYDEPLGKHDGSVNGRRYFQCPPKYGAFVRPHSVTPGDFPEEEEEEEEGLEDEL